MASKPGMDKDALFAEYSAANDVYIHFDSYSWAVGSVLIAGVFVFWGFLLGMNLDPQGHPYFLIIATTLVNLIISLWMLYADHNRQIVLSKLHRIHQIEEKLGMKQHLGWVDHKGNKRIYRTFGLKGHIIDLIIFLLTSLGTPFIGILISNGTWNWGWAIPISISLLTFIFVRLNEFRIKKHLKSINN